MLSQKEVIDRAREIRDWVENAVGEMAYTSIEFLDEKWREVVRDMKRQKVGDVKGALADRFYEDEDTLADLTGDRIYDAGSGDWADMVRIAFQIRSNNAHRPLRRTMNKHIARWRKYAADHKCDSIVFDMLTMMDFFTLYAFGHTLTRAWETECCLKCGIKHGNPPPEFWLKGLCESCVTMLKLKEKEAA